MKKQNKTQDFEHTETKLTGKDWNSYTVSKKGKNNGTVKTVVKKWMCTTLFRYHQTLFMALSTAQRQADKVEIIS